MPPALLALTIFAVMLGIAAFGLWCQGWLPEKMLDDDTRRHFTGTISVVATLTALVLGFAISNTNAVRQTITGDLALLGSSIERTGNLLGQYGPDAAAARATLAEFAERKRDELFRRGGGPRALLANPATDALLDRLQVAVVGLHPEDDLQRFRQAQALEGTGRIVTQTAAIGEQRHLAPPRQTMSNLTVWLAILFFSYGLFSPRHLTAFAAILGTAVAVTLALLIILEGRLPFDGWVPLPSGSLDAAVAMLRG